MLQRALEKAKRGDDKKVNINFQVPSILKDEFEKLCKESGVSVTAMLNSLMEVALEEKLGLSINDQDTMKLLDELDRAKKSFMQANQMVENGDQYVTATDGTEIDFSLEAKIASAKIEAIAIELEKRGKK
jgi:antitoxin component of RelBE/YafQ-DinJ toxin-antitoxin module